MNVQQAGLSRRGWILFAASTAVVAAVLLAGAALLIGAPDGPARAHPTSTPPTEWVPTPDPDLAPTPLGLPPRPSPTNTATAPVQAVGSLKTGDCLQTFSSPRADGYPVVSCDVPHIAQLISRGVLPQTAGASFPGAKAVESQVTGLCSAPGLLNWDWVAVWNEDVQTEMSFPDTAAQWESGARSYYCFVDTFSRHELTGSAVAAH